MAWFSAAAFPCFGVAIFLVCGCSTSRLADLGSHVGELAGNWEAAQLADPAIHLPGALPAGVDLARVNRDAAPAATYGLAPDDVVIANRRLNRLSTVIAAPGVVPSPSDRLAAPASDRQMGTAVQDSQASAEARPRLDRAALPTTDTEISRQFASASLGDSQLGDIRGGIDTGSGVELNFAFQQATFLNHNLVQNIVVPTITVGQNVVALGGNPVTSVVPSGTPSASNVIIPTVSTGALAGLGMTGMPSGTNTASANSPTIVSNGVGLQVNSSI